MPDVSRRRDAARDPFERTPVLFQYETKTRDVELVPGAEKARSRDRIHNPGRVFSSSSRRRRRASRAEIQVERHEHRTASELFSVHERVWQSSAAE